jgi:hypothetical protein
MHLLTGDHRIQYDFFVETGVLAVVGGASGTTRVSLFVQMRPLHCECWREVRSLSAPGSEWQTDLACLMKKLAGA